MKRIIGLSAIGAVVVFLMSGCGGGGVSESTPAVKSPSQSLQGTYAFAGFDVNYSNGTTVVNINENSPSIASWSGTMEFGTDTLSQFFSINNARTSLTGSVTVTWAREGVAGTAHVTDANGTHDLEFTISGNNLTTYSGVIPYGTPNVTVEEYNYWTKVSDSGSPATERSITGKSGEPAATGTRRVAGSPAQ